MIPSLNGSAACSRAIGTWIKATILAIIWPFTATYAFYKRSGLLIKLTLGVLIIPFVLGYAWFFWHAAWIRDYDVDYPDRFNFAERPARRRRTGCAGRRGQYDPDLRTFALSSM